MHKYRRSIFGLIFIALISLAMSGFGVDYLRGRSEPYAIKVDEHHISFDEFHRQRRELEQRYRQIFGKNFDSFSSQMNFNFAQMTIDKTINDYLIEREAKKLGLAVSDAEVSDIIKTQLFGGMFSSEAYAGFLRQNAQTSTQFEEQVRADAVRQAYIGLLRTVSLASEKETRAALKISETAYNIDYLEFDPQYYIKAVKEPETQALAEFFKQNSASYELPPRISYDYIVFDPEKNLDLVEVAPEDVELYYADNQSQFVNPEKAKVRHVQLNYAKDASPQQMAELKDKAKQVHAKAQAGESFENLALQYSDDITTKTLGGDLGWITKGLKGPAFDAAVFKSQNVGILEVVETDYGFHIVKLEEHKAQTPKELAEVKPEIEQIIRRREAPTYTAEKANQVFESLRKSKQSLAEFANGNKLVAASTNKLLTATVDPEPGLVGLTQKALDFPDDKLQLIDIGDNTVIVAIKEYRDTEVPGLEAVRQQVLENFKKQEAKKLSLQKAQDLIAATKATNSKTLKQAASEAKLELKNVADLQSNTASSKPPFVDPKLQKAVFSAKLNEISAQPLESFGKYIVYQISAIKEPEVATINQKLDEARKRESQELAQQLITSITNSLKAGSIIDVAAGLARQDF